MRDRPAAGAPLVAREHVPQLLAGACLVGIVLVLTPVSVGVRALVVLPIALLVPGLCITRRIALREPLVELALAFPISGALLVAVAQAELYLHAWHPRAGLLVLLLASAASLAPELHRRATPERAR